jgi:hypothetical protein
MHTIVSASFAAASTTCSQLSRTRRSLLPPMAAATDSGEISLPAKFKPRTPATVDATRLGSDSETRSTSQQSPSNAGNRLRATSIANTVFPIPPGPVSVIIRETERNACRCFMAAVRPTSAELAAGTLVKHGRTRIPIGPRAIPSARVPSFRIVQSPTRRYPRPKDVFSAPRSVPSALRNALMWT